MKEGGRKGGVGPGGGRGSHSLAPGPEAANVAHPELAEGISDGALHGLGLHVGGLGQRHDIACHKDGEGLHHVLVLYQHIVLSPELTGKRKTERGGGDKKHRKGRGGGGGGARAA